MLKLKDSLLHPQVAKGNFEITEEEFLSHKECDEFITEIKIGNLTDSTVGLGGKRVKDISRSSKTVSLCDCTPSVMKLKKRIAKHLNIPIENFEALQGQVYQVGDYFNRHLDSFDSINIKKFGLHSGNRTKTFMIYLNSDFYGGVTYFNNIDRGYMPIKGNAVSWDNLTEEGKVQQAAMHEGQKIEEGKKYIITAFIRQNKWDPSLDDKLYEEYLNETKDLPPQYGKAFDIIDTPNEVTNLITTFLLKHKDNIKDEQELHEIDGKSRIYSLDKEPSITQRIHEIYLPIAESMSNQKLEPTFIYGVRSYTKGSSLKMHRDRIDTHAVSFSVTYSKDANWPLVCEGEDLNEYKLELEPGKSLYYNGSRYKHGRPTKFTGEEYLNFYVHYKIKTKPTITTRSNSHIKMI